MKNLQRFSGVIILIILFFLINSCKKEELPTLTTAFINHISGTSAISGGEVISWGSKPLNSRGLCWSTGNTPTIDDNITAAGSGLGSFTSNIAGLQPLTTYYARAYATSGAGTGYGSIKSFKTLQSGQLSDIEGNIYNSVTIGTQVWMKENLRTVKYNDGTFIPKVTDGTAWARLTTPGYCWYNNDALTYKATYGALYNWYALNITYNGKKNICPVGWHVPSNNELLALITPLGGSSAGGKLKDISLWKSPNEGATNETGFSGLPGGRRQIDGTYNLERALGSWWCSTAYNLVGHAWYWMLYSDYRNVVNTDGLARFGHSVRCLKD